MTPTQHAILRYLARYRLLTNSQLVHICHRHYDTIQEATHRLSSKPAHLLIKHRFPVHARFGKQEQVYRLSPRGAEAVMETEGLLELPTIPKSASFNLDFHHRKIVIDFRIGLDKALAATSWKVDHWDNYFDMVGANRGNGSPLHAQTRINFADGSFCIPDSFLHLRAEKKHLLLTLEVVRGQKLERTLAQIRRHMTMLKERTASMKYALPQGQNALSVFLLEENALLLKVLAELTSTHEFQPFTNHFLFASVDDLQRHFSGCWHQVGNAKYRIHLLSGRPAFRDRET